MSETPSAENDEPETFTRDDMVRAFNAGVVAQREATRASGGAVGRIVATNPYALIPPGARLGSCCLNVGTDACVCDRPTTPIPPGQTADNGLGRDALAMALVENDPDPCDPIEYDAAAYYRDFADALIASGYRVIPPGVRLGSCCLNVGTDACVCQNPTTPISPGGSDE